MPRTVASREPWLNHGIEINHVTTTVVGSLAYKEGHALCEGRVASIKEEQKVMENRASIPADLRQGQGINTDFGTLWLRQWRTPSQWKKVKDITAI